MRHFYDILEHLSNNIFIINSSI